MGGKRPSTQPLKNTVFPMKFITFATTICSGKTNRHNKYSSLHWRSRPLSSHSLGHRQGRFSRGRQKPRKNQQKQNKQRSSHYSSPSPRIVFETLFFVVVWFLGFFSWLLSFLQIVVCADSGGVLCCYRVYCSATGLYYSITGLYCVILLQGCIILLPECIILVQGCIILLEGCITLVQGCIILLQGCILLLQECIILLQGCTILQQGCFILLQGCIILLQDCVILLQGILYCYR